MTCLRLRWNFALPKNLGLPKKPCPSAKQCRKPAAERVAAHNRSGSGGTSPSDDMHAAQVELRPPKKPCPSQKPGPSEKQSRKPAAERVAAHNRSGSGGTSPSDDMHAAQVELRPPPKKNRPAKNHARMWGQSDFARRYLVRKRSAQTAKRSSSMARRMPRIRSW
jgi:hypothetical protein